MRPLGPGRPPFARRGHAKVIIAIVALGLIAGLVLLYPLPHSATHGVPPHLDMLLSTTDQGVRDGNMAVQHPSAGPHLLPLRQRQQPVVVDTSDIRHPHNREQLLQQQAATLQHDTHDAVRQTQSVRPGHLPQQEQQEQQHQQQQQRQQQQQQWQAASSETAKQAVAAAQPVASRAGQAQPQLMTQRASTAPGTGCQAPGAGCGLPGHTIHTLFTSNGSPYQNIQARIMIGTWQRVRSQPFGDHLVALTRILHRTKPDILMEEVDTFRADPVQPECDTWCWFPVADRANAVRQWLAAVEAAPQLQKAPWLLMLETDYVWIKPLQVPGSAYDKDVAGLAFTFDYMRPGNPYVAQMLGEQCPTCAVSTVPRSGPAPVLARFEDFQAAVPAWEKWSLWIEQHEDAKKSLGWVREMYAWDVAVAAERLNIQDVGPPHSTLIAQPPHDLEPGAATMYHYTWATDIQNATTGARVYLFDKRVYTDAKDALKVPRIPSPPEWREGLRLADRKPYTRELAATVAHMVALMNDAIDRLMDLTLQAGPRLATAAAT